MTNNFTVHPTARRRRATGPKWNFAEWFVLAQTFIPALMFVPGTQPLRVPIRTASYALSLGALAYFWFTEKSRARLFAHLHRSVPWLIAVLVYLTLMLFHPTTNSVLAGIAQIGLYLAILAPILWVQACVDDPRRLRRLLWLLLLCNGINSFVGVMQVRDPNAWMPREFSAVFTESEFGLGTVVYEGANGDAIIRPPGLGDAPGAVAGPAIFALFFGLVFAVSERNWWRKGVALIFAWLGAQAIFLTLVRSSLLIAMAAVALFFLIQLARRQVAQAGALILVSLAAIMFAFIQSAKTGGESLVERFKTITAGDPVSFYYENRGNQVEAGFAELLPKYPFGAGLGRYGMMNTYFGNSSNADSPPIWVEIQWPAWIVDGGFILCLLYPISLGIALWQQAKVSFRGRDELQRQTASIILAANTGLICLCFSYPVFLSPMGIQFWFLAGAVHGASIVGVRLSNGNRAVMGAAKVGPRIIGERTGGETVIRHGLDALELGSTGVIIT